MRKYIVLAAVLSLSACAPKTHKAEALLAPTRGNTASGHVAFSQAGRTVLIKGDFSGLTPGAHGFHIHEKGDCSAPDARSAGGHFNPTRTRHGDPARAAHHAGDLPMLTAGADGKARFEARMTGLGLTEGPDSIMSRSILVDARPDDFTTQPDGNSGPHVACGVIRAR